MITIAFGHKKNTGKDTAAKFITTDYRLRHSGSTIIKVGFADKLKHIAHNLYGWAGVKEKEYYDERPERKEDIIEALGKSVRQIYIDIGMKMREIYPHTWIDYALSHTIPPDLLVIPDLRFPNEFERIKIMRGYCVKIVRPDIPDTDDSADCALNGHDDWDYILTNDGDLNTFHDKIINMLKEIENHG